MNYPTMKLVLVSVVFFGISACGGSGGNDGNTQVPDCPTGTADYVSCWQKPGCNPVQASGGTQWDIDRYYLTDDGRFFNFRWVYDNVSCTGAPLFTDNGEVVRLINFTDSGIETFSPSGLTGHRLVFESTSPNSSQPTYDVLTAVTGTSQLCLSNNIDLSGDSYTFVFQDGTDVDITNCLDPVAP